MAYAIKCDRCGSVIAFNKASAADLPLPPVEITVQRPTEDGTAQDGGEEFDLCAPCGQDLDRFLEVPPPKAEGA